MKAGEAKLKYLGRTLTDADGTIWCALSGSGVEFRYKGTSLDVVLVGDDLTRLPKQQYEKVKTEQDVDYARIAIGYISLGSLDDSVKALKIDGAEASADNISNGSYKVSRPFNIATKGTPNEVTQDFINFILSEDGQNLCRCSLPDRL